MPPSEQTRQSEIETPGDGPRIGERLKAERIQQRLKAERIQERLKAERIQERLEELPAGWRTAPDGAGLVRTFRLPTLGVAGQFVGLVYGIGDAVGFVPRIAAGGEEVTLTVATGADPGAESGADPGVTDLDFDVARLFHLGA